MQENVSVFWWKNEIAPIIIHKNLLCWLLYRKIDHREGLEFKVSLSHTVHLLQTWVSVRSTIAVIKHPKMALLEQSASLQNAETPAWGCPHPQRTEPPQLISN